MAESSDHRGVAEKRDLSDSDREELGWQNSRRIRLKISTLPLDSDDSRDSLGFDKYDCEEVGVVCSQPRSPRVLPAERPKNPVTQNPVASEEGKEDMKTGQRHSLTASEREEKVKILMEMATESRRRRANSVFAGLLPTLKRKNGRLLFRTGSKSQQRNKN